MFCFIVRNFQQGTLNIEENFLRDAAPLNSTLKGDLAFYKGGTQAEISSRHYRVCSGLREDTKDFNS